MAKTPEHVRRLDAQIEAFKLELKPLEAGTLHVAEMKGANAHWQDITERQIVRLKAIIDNLAAVRAAIDSRR